MKKTLVICSMLAAVGGLWGASGAMAQSAAPPAQATPASPTTPNPTPSPTATPEPTAVIITTSPQPLLVGGMEVDKTPATVLLGTNVCVARSTFYNSESERWTFQGWSSGST